MNALDMLRSLRTLLSAPGRLALTLVGIVIGSAAIVMVMGLLESGKVALIRANQGVTDSDRLVISRRDLPAREARHGRPELSRRDAAAIAQGRLADDAAVHVDSGREARAYHRDRNKRVRVVSGTPNMMALYRIEVAQGRFLQSSDLDARRRVCVVGDEIYRELLRELPLGKDVALSIDGTRWQVVGVLKPKPMLGSTTGTRIWARKVIVPATSFDLRYAQTHGADRLIVRSPEHQQATFRSALSSLLRRRHHGARNFEIEDPSGREQEALIMSVIQLLLVGTGALALFVGGINVMNVMLVRVSERTREIGLRRALGATRRSVLLLFLSESVLLSIVGGAVGMIAGSAIVTLAVFGLGRLFAGFPLILPGAAFGLAAGLSLVTGVLFGVLPAWRAARLDPVQALRQE
ncbi:MAG: ABC transporter permease [Polyangiaceae bacterium]